MRKVTSKRSHRKGHITRREKIAKITKVTSGQNVVNMLINCLQYFKHKLGRKALETAYKSFIFKLLFLFLYLAQLYQYPNLTHWKTFILKPYKSSLVCPGNKPTNSFFPSTTFLWNNRPVNIPQSSSLSHFKRYLTNNHTKVPAYYYSGKMNNFNSIFSSGVSLKTSHALAARTLFCYSVQTITIYL